jgi:hypothetical protein
MLGRSYVATFVVILSEAKDLSALGHRLGESISTNLAADLTDLNGSERLQRLVERQELTL